MLDQLEKWWNISDTYILSTGKRVRDRASSEILKLRTSCEWANTWGSVSIRSSQQKNILNTNCLWTGNTWGLGSIDQASSKHFKHVRSVNGQRMWIAVSMRSSQQPSIQRTYGLWTTKCVRFGQHESKSMAKHSEHLHSINGQSTRGLVSMRSSNWWNISGTYNLSTKQMSEAWSACDQANGETFQVRTHL